MENIYNTLKILKRLIRTEFTSSDTYDSVTIDTEKFYMVRSPTLFKFRKKHCVDFTRINYMEEQLENYRWESMLLINAYVIRMK